MVYISNTACGRHGTFFIREIIMKILTVITALLATVLVVTTQPTEAGVSISVGEPGFYGRVDIGNYPPPRLIYEEPVIVRRVKTWYPPIYLRVPPGHVNQWYKHCDRYEACGRPVYFIQDDWYREVYVPRYREYRYEGDTRLDRQLRCIDRNITNIGNIVINQAKRYISARTITIPIDPLGTTVGASTIIERISVSYRSLSTVQAF